jgi:serine/threonine protein kinase
MPILPGRRLGPYEILSTIGAGGMGEVYKARDTRLDRIVAIKVLPTHLADRSELRNRFEREAKTVAILNHPHICERLAQTFRLRSHHHAKPIRRPAVCEGNKAPCPNLWTGDTDKRVGAEGIYRGQPKGATSASPLGFFYGGSRPGWNRLGKSYPVTPVGSAIVSATDIPFN